MSIWFCRPPVVAETQHALPRMDGCGTTPTFCLIVMFVLTYTASLFRVFLSTTEVFQGSSFLSLSLVTDTTRLYVWVGGVQETAKLALLMFSVRRVQYYTVFFSVRTSGVVSTRQQQHQTTLAYRLVLTQPPSFDRLASIFVLYGVGAYCGKLRVQSHLSSYTFNHETIPAAYMDCNISTRNMFRLLLLFRQMK